MISCSDAVRQLWEYLDGDVTTTDRGHIEAHLALCRRCCGEAEFTVALRDLLRSSGGPAIPATVHDDLIGFLGSLEKEVP